MVNNVFQSNRMVVSHWLLFIFFYQWWPSLISDQHKKTIKLHSNREPCKGYYRRVFFQMVILKWSKCFICYMVLLGFVVYNISVISWHSVLLVEETGLPVENHQPVASHWQTLSHNVVWSAPRLERGSNFTTLIVVIGIDCTGSCKSNYHMITTTVAPRFICLKYMKKKF